MLSYAPKISNIYRPEALYGRKQSTRAAKRLVAGLILASAAILLCPVAVLAQYPNKLIRMVVAFPPGGATDLLARIVAGKLRDSMGQTVVVDNKSGASGVIGAEVVVRSPPDGYTILYTASTIVVSPWIQKVPFDTEKDLIPVSQTTASTYALVTAPKFPANTFQEFLAYVRKQPGRFNYGSFGHGSGPHLTMEMLKNLAKVEITHVPYKGSAPMLTDLIADQIDMAFDAPSSVLPYIGAGRLKALAVAGPQPVDVLPGVPTISQMFPGFDTDAWQGVFVPAGTPREIVGKLSGEIAKAFRSPEIIKLFSERGFRAVAKGHEEFSTYMKAELSKYEKVIKENNIRGE